MPWRRRIKTPLEDVAVDHRGAGNVALCGSLFGRPDVDEQSPGCQFLGGASGVDAHEPRPSPREQLINVQGHGDATSFAVYGVAGAAASTAIRGISTVRLKTGTTARAIAPAAATTTVEARNITRAPS